MIEKSLDGSLNCSVCGKTGKKYSNMKNHVEIHVEGLSYPCQSCNHTFRSKDSLRNHMYRSHKWLIAGTSMHWKITEELCINSSRRISEYRSDKVLGLVIPILYFRANFQYLLCLTILLQFNPTFWMRQHL